MKCRMHITGDHQFVDERRLTYFAMENPAEKIQRLENEKEAMKKELVDLRNLHNETLKRLSALEGMSKKNPSFDNLAAQNGVRKNSAYEKSINAPAHERHRMNSYFNRVTRRTLNQHPGYQPYNSQRSMPVHGQWRTRYSSRDGEYLEFFNADTGRWEQSQDEFTPATRDNPEGRRLRSSAEVRAQGRAFGQKFDAEWQRSNGPMSYEQKELLRNRMNPVRQEMLRTRAKAREIMGKEFFSDMPKRRMSESEVRYRQHRSQIEGGAQDYGDNYFVAPLRKSMQERRLETKTERTFSQIPYDYDKYQTIDQRFGNLGDDVQRIKEYHDELRAEWPHLPLAERRYRISRLKTLRDSMQKIHRQHEHMEAQRERLQYRDVLRTIEVPVQNSMEPIRITLPAGFTSFDNGKVHEILYYPYNSSFRRSDAAVADEAGIVFENAPAGYKDGLGREAVRGVYVHFKTQGLFGVNGHFYDVQPAIKKQPLNKESTEPWNTRRKPINYPQN